MNLPNTPAIARLSTIIGVDVPSGVKDLVSPFALALPAAVDVTATPGSAHLPEGAFHTLLNAILGG